MHSFLTISLSTTLHGFLESVVFSLYTPVLSTSSIKLAKPDFDGRLYLSTPVAAKVDWSYTTLSFPTKCWCGLGKYWLILYNIFILRSFYISSY